MITALLCALNALAITRSLREANVGRDSPGWGHCVVRAQPYEIARATRRAFLEPRALHAMRGELEELRDICIEQRDTRCEDRVGALLWSEKGNSALQAGGGLSVMYGGTCGQRAKWTRSADGGSSEGQSRQ